MASNYWDSTQANHGTFTKPALASIRADLAKSYAPVHTKYPLPDPRHVNIYIQAHLIKLARRMGLRQQALATAQAYLKRFYLRVEFRKTNPYLIMATAVYLACKMEECPQHIRLMLGEAVRQWPEIGVSETSKIGECEFALISTLGSRLICHHPYRALGELGPVFGLVPEETQLASWVLNDCYCTDLVLLYPPHVLAVTAIFLAVTLRPAGGGQGNFTASGGAGPAFSGPTAQQAVSTAFGGLKHAGPRLGKLVDWLAESKVDMNAIVDATQEIVSLYNAWETYSERACKDGITRFLKDGLGMM